MQISKGIEAGEMQSRHSRLLFSSKNETDADRGNTISKRDSLGQPNY